MIRIATVTQVDTTAQIAGFEELKELFRWAQDALSLSRTAKAEVTRDIARRIRRELTTTIGAIVEGMTHEELISYLEWAKTA